MLRPIERLVPLVVLVAALAVAPSPCGAETTAAPWDGLHRDELRVLLGQPSKIKRSRDGRETWSFSLVRLDAGEAVAADQRVVDVPGIGPCATLSSEGDPTVQESLSIEPTATDSRGRPTGGGLTKSQSKSVTWSEDSKANRPDSGAPARKNEGRRLALRLVLGPDQRVVSWTSQWWR